MGALGDAIATEMAGATASLLNDITGHTAQVVIATSGGLTTGLIAAGTGQCTVTSDSSTKKISLPAGQLKDVITILMGSTGCMLIAVTAGDKVNNVIVGATNQLALVANAYYKCEYLGANNWRVRGWTQAGSPIAISTAALTTITIADAEGTPDYAFAAMTQTTPWGFPSAQELISCLYVIQNLQVQVAELRAALNLTPVAI